MKKVFISFRYTGENKAELKRIIPQLHETLEKAGYVVYSTIFDSDKFAEENISGKEIMRKAFQEIDNSDLILFFVRTSDISQGMLVELGYSLAKRKNLLLAIQKDIKVNIFRRQINQIIDFKDLEELKGKLMKI
jgi:nucleoside 2-deoxyribosyltransferase